MREMSLMRRVLLVSFTLLVLATLWVVWNRPTKVDMAAYAPADSLAYLECNNPTEVVTALHRTEAWRNLAPLFRLNDNETSSWFESFARLTGLAPTELVVSSRAQLAVAVMNLGTFEEAENLKVKPELAVIIETHSSRWRIRPLAERLLSQLATNTYGNPTFRTVQKNGSEFLIWTAPTESREIVAAVDDSVVLVGNTEAAVEACLAVRRGARPNLGSNADLQSMRARLDSQRSLAFGFVSSGNAPRLASITAPLLVGATDSGFQQILPTAAGKILGSIGWASRLNNGTIEDRYLFSLSKPVASKLQSGFKPVSQDDQLLGRMLGQAASATVYRFENPYGAWQAFESAMLSQLDAVSAVVFKTLLKSSLATYGIEDAEQFVKLVGPEIATLRVNENSPRSTIVATVSASEALPKIVEMSVGKNSKRTGNDNGEIYEGAGKEQVVGFSNGRVFIGPGEDVRTWITSLSTNSVGGRDIPAPLVEAAVVRSISNDSQRVKNFFIAIASAQGSGSSGITEDNLDAALAKIPLAITESSVVNEGIERRTRSPLGQFGTLAAVFFSR